MSTAAAIGGVMEGIKIVKDIANNIKNETKEALTPENVQINSAAVQGAIVEGDVTRLIKSTLIEPMILVTDNALYSEVIDRVNDVILDNVVAYYIQIFDMLTKIAGKSSLEAIDLLSSNLYNYDSIISAAKKKARKALIKSATSAMSKEQRLGLESLNFDDSITYMNDNELKEYKISLREIATEAEIDDDTLETMIEAINDYTKDERTIAEISGANQTAAARNRNQLVSTFFDPKDGTLCKILTRQFVVSIVIPMPSGNFNHTVCIPITARANVKVINIQDLVPVISSKDAKKTLLARFHEWRSGAISLLEFIFCGDMIKNYKEGKLDKNSKLLTEIENKNVAAFLRQQLTGSKGFESMYTNLVLTSDEINYLSKIAMVGGKGAFDVSFKVNGTGMVDLESNTGKEFLLNAISGFTLTVIDTERVRMYLKGIKGCLDVHYKAFKRRTDSSNDVLDFFKAISTGNAIRF